MAGKSFYDLDYIIEINEQRFEQYMSAYNELMGKLTNIVLIYSAVAIFLIPIMRNVFWGGEANWVLNTSFVIFAVFFSVSIFFTIRLIIPKAVIYLEIPTKYYNEFRTKYEQVTNDRMVLEDFLKASYITDLEDSLEFNRQIFIRKYTFYFKAMIFALMALLPYLVCFWSYISNERSSIIKETEIVKIRDL
jgi:hypothetical protein